MRQILIVTVLLLILSLQNVASQNFQKPTQLKTELLSNLNRHSNSFSEKLELLSDNNKHVVETTDTTTLAPIRVLPEIANSFSTPLPPLKGLLNIFQPPSSFPGLTNLFNGVFPLRQVSTTAVPVPQMQIPFAVKHQHVPTTTLIPIPGGLSTFVSPGFLIQNNVLERNLGTDNKDDKIGRPIFVNRTFINTTTIPKLQKTLTDAVAENIRDWRQKFYKAFKKLKPKRRSEFTRTVASITTTTTVMPLKVQTLSPVPISRPDTNTVAINIPNETKVDRNKQVFIARKNPNFLSSQKVKTFAKDSKGRIVRLFGVESSGYRFNDTNANGFIPLPEPPMLPAQNLDVRPVYIPAAQPTATPPPGYGVSYLSYSTPSPVISPALSNFAPAPPPFNVYTVKMPSSPDVMQIISNPSDASLTREVETADYDDELPETDQPCEDSSSQQPANDYYIESGITTKGVFESNEKCNSMRLRYIIEESIVEGNAEMSKRTIQERAEDEAGIFFNVICGTGFFSYIAHTDEFCQASALGINCYVFSPVCSLRPPVTVSGIAKLKLKTKKAMRRAVVNKN